MLYFRIHQEDSKQMIEFKCRRSLTGFGIQKKLNIHKRNIMIFFDINGKKGFKTLSFFYICFLKHSNIGMHAPLTAIIKQGQSLDLDSQSIDKLVHNGTIDTIIHICP